MDRFVLRMAAFIGASLVSLGCLAQDPRWYVGGAVGQSELTDACEGVPVSCDDTGTAFKLFGGYQFSRHIAAELAYTDFGKATANGTISGVSVNATAKSKAWELVGVGTFPINEALGLYGKAGLYRAKTEVSGSAAVAGFSVSATDSESNTGWTLGFGGRYDFTRNLGMRIEWQRYERVGGDRVGGKSDVDVLSAGVLVKF